MGTLRQIKRGLDRGLEWLVVIVMAVLVLDVTWQVITRFLLPKPSSWTEELATFLMIWVGLLGASVALKRRAHLGIDYFVGKLSPRRQVLTGIVAFTLTTLFSLFVMVIGGITLVTRMLMGAQTSAALGIRMGYVYLAVPISGAFLVLYSIEGLLETIRGGRADAGAEAAPSESTETGVD